MSAATRARTGTGELFVLVGGGVLLMMRLATVGRGETAVASLLLVYIALLGLSLAYLARARAGIARAGIGAVTAGAGAAGPAAPVGTAVRHAASATRGPRARTSLGRALTWERAQQIAPLLLGVAAVASVRLLLPHPVPVAGSGAGATLSVLAAIAEEAFFRGALFARLERSGRLIAIIGSAAAFAALHVPFYGVPALPLDLGAGVLFSWQRSETGSWLAPAATHVAANLLAVLP